MHRILYLWIASLLLATSGAAQTPQASSTYTLQAQRERRPHWSLSYGVLPPSSTITVTPDNFLLILLPQPNEKWVLKRLTSWNSETPTEETLTITDERQHEDDAWHYADLTVNPAGTYLIVRINSNHRRTGIAALKTDSLVVIVDLRTFGIVSRRVTADPLIAGSGWRFNENGLLVAAGITRVPESKLRDAKITTYTAGVLDIPGLKQVASCQYDQIWQYTGSKTVAEEHANLDCAVVLDAAGVSAVANLPGDYPANRIAQRLKFKGQMMNVSKDERFVLYSCGTGYRTMWDTTKTTSRQSVVASVSDGRTVISISTPIKQPVVGTFGTAGGQDYLILLRDGITVETYTLAWPITR